MKSATQTTTSAGLFALDRNFALEAVRVTEAAALAANRWMGRGDEKEADRAAVNAMREALNGMSIDGTVVIGEGERDKAPMLYIGEKVGNAAGHGPKVDIALDPLEGTTICAKNLPNALAVVAIAEEGSLLNAPDVYMQKIAVGPGLPQGVVELDAAPAENIHALAKAKGVTASEITACILDRPRHARMIDEVRKTGASIRLIGDGDVAGIIHVTEPEETGIDIYMGIGGAPEGVLAAAALRCIGGQMQGRLVINSDEQRERAIRMGIKDIDRKYMAEEMARGDVLFAATGVTDGNLLSGVRFGRDSITTHTVVMRSSSGTVRWIKAQHQDLDKFDGDN
jgi:fructose-1,6-bisphosphatase II / sedoheptulose-1,7-bisphosphatase